MFVNDVWEFIKVNSTRYLSNKNSLSTNAK